MLNSTQTKNLINVYNFFMESEPKGWTAIDDYLEMLEYLDDIQLCKESEVLYSYHENKNMGCPYTHKSGATCFVKFILESVEAIVELYKETNNLHIKNRYILCYYLALSHDGQIIEMLED